MGRQLLLFLLSSALCTGPSFSFAGPPRPEQAHSSEQVQVSPPPMRRAEAPAATASVAELEERGDTLRAEKAYLDALDYYRTAIAKEPNNAKLYNKIGIAELQLSRFNEARKDFELAIKNYEAAIKLRHDSASFYSNLGAAYFSRNQFEKASLAYKEALRIDPDIFEKTSRTGVQLQMSSPGDRAHFYYVLARLYAKAGVTDRSLQYLRRAMEEGYKGIENVYKDSEFATLRKDPRFTELMAARPVAIPE